MNNLVKQVEEKDINEIKEFVDETLKVTKQQIDNPDESVRYYPTLKLTTLEVPATLILSMIKLLDHYQEQPKLSIPKKIAEELLEGDKIKHPSYELMFNEDGEWSEELQEWMETTDKWWAIVDAYLAGKALGVELVSIEED